MIKNQLNPDWHAVSVEDTAAQLATHPVNGLTASEANTRLSQVGPNSLTIEKKESLWEEFLEELREPMVLLLLLTGVLYAIWGELSDAITIFVIILALNTVEVVNEQRSKKAIASLRKLAEPTAAVLRDGQFQELPVEQIVPGDLVMLQAGRRVPADARLVEAVGLSVDESTLTGESLPVGKEADSIFTADLPLAERRNLVFSSTLVTRGKGKALVVSTGMQTEIGRIAGMARQIKEPRTPLQHAMEELSRWLVWVALSFSLLVPLLGIFVAHQPVRQMLLTGLSLAFATIPEELPIIITMVLALGAFRLSKKNAIARRLKAVETLGAITVIATDKTGTLTENRMAVAALEPESRKRRLLEIGVLCNDAIQNGNDFAGDPLEAALLRAAQKAGMDVKAMRQAFPIKSEFSFEPVRKRMSSVYQKDGHLWAAVKGAPEAILARCTREVDGRQAVKVMSEPDRLAILQKAAEMAAGGLRVIALAERTLPEGSPAQDTVESDLTYVGLAGMADPPRPEVPAAIWICQKAGIRTMMVTGDHPLTARSIGRQVGLNGDLTVMTGPELDNLSEEALKEAVQRVSIFARTTPEHKLRIVQALESLGERVAVTGDGVNDAPALVAADIGVAMGETGTDVAREAGDLILADDNFTTIVHAVEEGRLLFENLKKGVRYYLTCKVALVLVTLLPTLLLAPVPFAPVQIILMELFMDLAAAATFVAEPAEADLLQRKPRDPKAKFMDSVMVSSIFTSASGLFAAVSAVYLITWYGSGNLAMSQTVAFYAWLLGHVLLALNMRSERQPVFQLGFAKNRLMLVWGGAVVLFLILLSLIPPAQQALKIVPPTASQWAMILGFTLIGTFWIEVRKIIWYPTLHTRS